MESNHEYLEKFREAMQWLHPLTIVRTPHGIGTVVSIDIPFNGLYYSPEQAKIVVWYGMNDVQCGWVSHSYTFDELTPVIDQ